MNFKNDLNCERLISQTVSSWDLHAFSSAAALWAATLPPGGLKAHCRDANVVVDSCCGNAREAALAPTNHPRTLHLHRWESVASHPRQHTERLNSSPADLFRWIMRAMQIRWHETGFFLNLQIIHMFGTMVSSECL